MPPNPAVPAQTRTLPGALLPPRARGLEEAILLTVLYADVFSYPLSPDELYRRLIGVAADRRAFDRVLALLTKTHLRLTDGHVTWAGREHLVTLRRRRRQVAVNLWEWAERYAGWLARVPFVRMVAVSGSLAVDNAERTGDIDLFCITAPGRLWLARAWIVPLSKLTRARPGTFPLYLCPNYLLAADALQVPECNLFTAYEVTQAVPLRGGPTYRRFRAANRWVRDYLPQTPLPAETYRLHETPRPWYTRAAERVLCGRLGDVLDRSIYRFFVTFYRRRARRAGWAWARLQPAYQPGRYTIPEGGYVRAVRRRFVKRLEEHLGESLPPDTLARLFPTVADTPEPACYDWDRLFADDYDDRPAHPP